MKYWTVVAGGQLSHILGAPNEADIVDGLAPGETLIEGYFPADDFYLDANGGVLPRKAMSLALSAPDSSGAISLDEGESLSISGLPAGAVVDAFSLQVTVEGTVAHLSGLAPSGYDRVIIQAPKFKQVEYAIHQRQLSEVIAQRCAKVDERRQYLGDLPVTYQGHTFDADAEAQANIVRCQSQIAAGVPLPDGFTWRDADNIAHPADARFLNGLGAVVLERDFQLRAAAWEHKRAIRDLAKISEVDAYDVLSGWPVDEG